MPSLAFVPSLMPVLLFSLFPAPAQPHLPAGTTQPPSWSCCLNSNKLPLPVRQRAHREFPTLLFPQAGVTHDILSLPSNLADEIPGAASHTPAPSWCSMWNNPRKCSSSFTSPISELNLPLPHKTYNGHWCCFGAVHLSHWMVLDQSHVCALVCQTQDVSERPNKPSLAEGEALLLILYVDPRREQWAEAALTTLSQKQKDCLDIWPYCDPAWSQKRSYAMEPPHF